MISGLSTSVGFDQLERSVTGIRERMERAGIEVATGKKSDLAGTNPTGARMSYSLRNNIVQWNTEIEKSDSVLTRASATQESLEQIRSAAIEVRDTATGAGRNTDIDLGQVSQTALSFAQQVVSFANTDVAGWNVFSGTASDTNALSTVGSEADAATPLGMTRQAFDDLLSGGGTAPAITQVSNRGDALSVMSKASVQIEADPGVNLSTGTQLKLSTGEVVGEVVVDEASSGEDRITMAFSRDYIPASGDVIEVDIEGTTVSTAALGATPTDQDAANALSTAVNGAAGGALSGSLNAGTNSVAYDGLDALFQDRQSAGNGYSDVVYNGSNSDVSTQVNGVDVQYGSRADQSAFRDIMNGMMTLAVADKSDRPAGISREGVNEIRDLAMERLQQGIDDLAKEQGRVGLAEQSLETEREALESRVHFAETSVSTIEQVDQFEAVTRLQELQTQLQAGYQSTAAVGRLSLVDFI